MNKETRSLNDSELLVGEGAKNQIARNPTNTVFGKSFLLKLLRVYKRRIWINVLFLFTFN